MGVGLYLKDSCILKAVVESSKTKTSDLRKEVIKKVEYRNRVEVVVMMFIKDIKYFLLSAGEEEGR